MMTPQFFAASGPPERSGRQPFPSLRRSVTYVPDYPEDYAHWQPRIYCSESHSQGVTRSENDWLTVSWSNDRSISWSLIPETGD